LGSGRVYKKIMNYKKTVTIGIPAHNEEANIKNLLNAILAQKQENFTLEKIIVICDGCTDATEEKVKEFSKNHSVVEIAADGQRKGKAQRLNELYRANASDIIVTLDADIILAAADTIGELIKKISDEYVVAGANFQPFKGKTIFEKFINAGDALWYEIRKNIRGGDSVYNSAGCAVALEKYFAKSIFYPKDTISDQVYLYLSVKSKGENFFFSEKAVVLYRNPSSLRDFLSMNSRSQFGRQVAGKYFGDLSSNEYRLNNVNKKGILLKMFTTKPFYTFLGAISLFALKFIPVAEKKIYKDGLWDTLKSTKNI